jgi:Cdc6-like AAA superfamily ATPase
VVAQIQGGKYNNKTVSLNPKIEDIDKLDFKSLVIPNNCYFQMMPDKTLERQIIYITGVSGSGKSTFTRKFVKEYKKIFKENEVYLFSCLTQDESLDEVKPKRFKINDELVTDPIEVSELANSLLIFDDIDTIANKKVKEAVYQLLNEVLQIGRHHKISAIVTNHLPTNFNWTRIILNESHIVVYFPSFATNKVKYLLEQYVDLEKSEIRRFKRMNSRWVAIFKWAPRIFLSEHEIGFLDQDSDDEDNKR